MFMGLYLTGRSLIDVPLTALAWFVLGLLAGRHVSRWPKCMSATEDGASDTSEMYVGNLAYEIGEKDLERIYGEYGRVASTRIIRHKFGGKSKGFGFVCMGTQAESDAAQKALSGREIKGRKLVVSQAKSRAR